MYLLNRSPTWQSSSLLPSSPPPPPFIESMDDSFGLLRNVQAWENDLLPAIEPLLADDDYGGDDGEGEEEPLYCIRFDDSFEPHSSESPSLESSSSSASFELYSSDSPSSESLTTARLSTTATTTTTTGQQPSQENSVHRSLERQERSAEMLERLGRGSRIRLFRQSEKSAAAELSAVDGPTPTFKLLNQSFGPLR